MAGPARSEAEILEACRAGDPEAAVALVALHQQAIFRVAGQLVGRWQAAEDIVQETFLRAFERIADIDPDRGALGWLLRTAVNLSRDFARHSGRRELAKPAGEEVEPLFAGSVPDPERTAEGHELGRKIDRAVAELSQKQREVVVLHYIEGLSFDAIARVVGAPVTVLKMRAVRARARLRDLLAEARS